MKRKTIIMMASLLLLFGCGSRKAADLQQFGGITVATIHTPYSLQDHTLVTDSTLSPPDPLETALSTDHSPTQTRAEESELPPIPAITEENPDQLESATPTPSPTAVPELSFSPTTPLENAVWDGSWNIWYQNSTGAYTSSLMTVQISGIRLTASASINGNIYTFKGDLSLQDTQVEGLWETSQEEGTFWWQMVAADTFVGSRETRFGFCGDRQSAERPSTCRKLP